MTPLRKRDPTTPRFPPAKQLYHPRIHSTLQLDSSGYLGGLQGPEEGEGGTSMDQGHSHQHHPHGSPCYSAIAITPHSPLEQAHLVGHLGFLCAPTRPAFQKC